MTAMTAVPNATPTRRTATIVGLLFLTQTIAFFVAEQLLTGGLKGPDFLTSASEHANAVTVGALLATISGAAVVGIAVIMFPLLKPTSEPLALGYVCERVVELVLQVAFFMVVPLLMVAVGDGLRDGTVNASAAASLGPSLKGVQDVAIVVLYLVTAVGGTIFGFLLYRSRLVPRFLAVLALVGYPVLFVGCILDMFGAIDVTKGAGAIFVVPGGLFELILPIWLLVKGFNASVHGLPGQDPVKIESALPVGV